VAAGTNIVLDSAASAARRLNSAQQSHSPRKTPQLRPSPTVSQQTAVALEPLAGSTGIEMQPPAASEALAGRAAMVIQPTAAAAVPEQGQPQLEAEERTMPPQEHVNGQEQVRQPSLCGSVTHSFLNHSVNPQSPFVAHGQVKRGTAVVN
jgi:hypothetical protein